MESRTHDEDSYEAQRAQANRAELVARISRMLHDDGQKEPEPGLSFRRASRPMGPIYGVSKPSFCVIAQGRKELFLGADRFQYDPLHYLLTTVELPVVGQIVDASPEQPYLSIRFSLDPTLIGSVLAEATNAVASRHGDVKAIDVSPLDTGLLDAVVRLVRLVESSNDRGVLYQLVTREIVYRLLEGAQGARLRYIATQGGDTQSITKAVELLQQDFKQPFRIEYMAQELGMSVSSLYHQFKAVTTLSPLQFQKRLRLQEARRLMIGERLDAASAGARVGYYDAAHFSREYKSLFGLPPMRDIERLREVAMEPVGR